MGRRLAVLGGLFALCGACGCTPINSEAIDMTAAGGGEPIAPDGNNKFQYILDSLTLPMSRTDFAIDLNGDGNKDNQFGNIVGALSAQNLDPQTAIDDSVKSGAVVLLMGVLTADTALKSDPAMGVTFHLGKSLSGMVTDAGVTGGPDFSGHGMFLIDASQAETDLFGRLSGGSFSSNNPVTTTHPASLTLRVALITGADPLSLVVHGCHAQFGIDANGVMSGQIQGSVKNDDIQKSIIPAVAMLLSAQVSKTPCSASCMQILSIFDTGGKSGTCTNPDGTMAKAMDHKIDICEVAENSIIENVLAPDVQIYAADGTTYAPNKLNTKKDSLSFGVGFTAVKATF